MRCPPPTAIVVLGSVALTCASRAVEPRQPAAGRLCPDSDVRVVAADARDLRDGCGGSRAALIFLAPHATRPIRTLEIDIQADLPDTVAPTAIGAYLKQCSCSKMLAYASFKHQRTWFKVPVSRGLYRSLATHEAAHAAAAQIFRIPNPTIQAQEYVAYVTMFATMEPLLRARALRALPGNGFATEDRISLIAYMFDPMHFGAEAYRHYMKPGNGDVFLHLVFAGKALAAE